MIEWTAGEVAAWARNRRAVDSSTEADVAAIVEDVRAEGPRAVRRYAVQFGDIEPDGLLVVAPADLAEAREQLDPQVREVLENAAGRIHRFALALRASLTDVEIDVPGGAAGHRWLPVASAGAYAPGGRYPLPSSILMTAVTARAAGVPLVVAASPKPSRVTLAAASIAGVDSLITVGGAQAIAAMAFGTLGPRADIVVGPGNRWVTAAKKYLFGELGIDGLAGPSEILVVADRGADPALVAADLIAQAEHDVDAVPMLISTSRSLATATSAEIQTQLAALRTAATASEAFSNGFTCVAASLDEAIDLANDIAPEHLALHIERAATAVEHFTAYGSVFVGQNAAETFADYGAGPNHVLPTSGGARYQSGLSVMSFLRAPTWLRLDDPTQLIGDTESLARLEGLEGHATAATLRS